MLKEHYKNSEYDVHFFPYDWRRSNSLSSQKLETFIQEKGYSKVVFVCHSMGGLVASSYIQSNPENRQKVEKLITLGTPYLGAPKALYVMETGNFFGNASDIVMSLPIKAIGGNLGGLYQLLPPRQYFDWNNTTYVDRYTMKLYHKQPPPLRGTRLNYQETMELLSQRSWARSTSGGVKPMLGQATAFHDRLLSPGPLALQGIDAYVVIGYGKDTIMEVREQFSEKGGFQKAKDITILNGGDGTVPVISASLGDRSPVDKTYYVLEGHAVLPKNLDVISLVKNIIDGKPAQYNASTISKVLPRAISGTGWLEGAPVKRVKLKIECPVNLTMIDPSSKEEWASVSNEWIFNEDQDRGTFYTLGEDNEIKIAFLKDFSSQVLLQGTGQGTMNYTASLFDAGYEIQRVLFRHVPITPSTKIHTDTWQGERLQLRLDMDGDGTIDKIISPTRVHVGKDLQEEIQDDPEDYSNYALISKSKILSTNLASKELKIQGNISSGGLLSVLSSQFEADGIFNAPSYLLNAKKQTLQQYPLQENLEERLQEHVEQNLDTGGKIPGSTVLGPTCFITKDRYQIPSSMAVKNHLVFTSKDLTTAKPVIVYAQTGSITITSSRIDLEGILYAPNGIVTLTGEQVNFNGVIIAQGIHITGTKTNIKNDLHLGRLGED